MINPDLYRSHLLNSIPTAVQASGGKQINCRCFFCPDGKNPSSKHFYISIPTEEKEPSLYYCHKCHSSGVMTYKKLIEEELGYRWYAMTTIGSGCTMHLNTEELPKGTLILSLSKHLTCVKDGVLYDTYDCSRDGTRCVYGYWIVE